MIFPKKKNSITKEFLLGAAPIEIWEAAFKSAKRSTFHKFKTGAVLFTQRGEIVAKGCAHKTASEFNAVNSIHAEMDALSKIYKSDYLKISCLIVTLSKSGNPAWSSRPCSICANNLYESGIYNVIYLERTNNGGWIINKESPAELSLRSMYGLDGKYARNLRI